jgi:hypothetical protein
LLSVTWSDPFELKLPPGLTFQPLAAWAVVALRVIASAATLPPRTIVLRRLRMYEFLPSSMNVY